MPTIDVLAFLLGSALILIGIVGGGVDIWALRVPAIGRGARFAALLAGTVFVMIGVAYKANQDSAAPSETQPASSFFDPSCIQEAEMNGRVIQMLSGSWRIQWLLGDVLHDAVLLMDGRQGMMRVHLTDQRTHQTDSVDMTMKLEIADQSVYLVYLVSDRKPPFFTSAPPLITVLS